MRRGNGGWRREKKVRVASVGEQLVPRNQQQQQLGASRATHTTQLYHETDGNLQELQTVKAIFDAAIPKKVVGMQLRAHYQSSY